MCYWCNWRPRIKHNSTSHSCPLRHWKSNTSVFVHLATLCSRRICADAFALVAKDPIYNVARQILFDLKEFVIPTVCTAIYTDRPCFRHLESMRWCHLMALVDFRIFLLSIAARWKNSCHIASASWIHIHLSSWCFGICWKTCWNEFMISTGSISTKKNWEIDFFTWWNCVPGDIPLGIRTISTTKYIKISKCKCALVEHVSLTERRLLIGVFITQTQREDEAVLRRCRRKNTVFPVEIDASLSVGDLKDAIKEEIPDKIKCDAYKLQLYLAKRGMGWLQDDNLEGLSLFVGVSRARRRPYESMILTSNFPTKTS